MVSTKHNLVHFTFNLLFYFHLWQKILCQKSYFVSFRYLDNVAYKVVESSSLYGGQPFTIDNSPHSIELNTAVGGKFYRGMVKVDGLTYLWCRKLARKSKQFHCVSAVPLYPSDIVCFVYNYYRCL
jgi:hypothetical protein